MVLNCFKCHAEVVFDSEHIGKNGKKIPLDPLTKTPHDCPMREKKVTVSGSTQNGDMVRVEMDKDDHGNEESKPISPKEYVERLDYVDHTAPTKGQSKVVVFFSNFSPDVMASYNTFLKENNGKIKTQGAHDHVTKLSDDLEDSSMQYTIYLYYEELKQ